MNRKVSSYRSKSNNRSNNGFIINSEENCDSGGNQNCNDNNNCVLDHCNPNFGEHQFQPVIEDFPRTDYLLNFSEQVSQPVTMNNIPVTEQPLPNFDGCISQPVIVEEIPQLEQLLPYSCMTNWWEL